jgi:hypothetical protein
MSDFWFYALLALRDGAWRRTRRVGDIIGPTGAACSKLARNGLVRIRYASGGQYREAQITERGAEKLKEALR